MIRYLSNLTMNFTVDNRVLDKKIKLCNIEVSVN